MREGGRLLSYETNKALEHCDRLGKDVVSWGDAATFRHRDGKKLKTKPTGAYIYHYGWVRSPEEMLKRNREFEKLYHDDRCIEEKYGDLKEFPTLNWILLENFMEPIL
jgi:hypothetical protein